MSGRGREALPEVREWSGRLPGSPGVVGRPSRKSECVRELSGEHLGCSGVSESGREALPDVKEWS